MIEGIKYPNNAKVVCFREFDGEWEALIADVRRKCGFQWSSLTVTRIYLQNDDLAILENAHCSIGVSAHHHIAAIWVVPKENYTPADSIHKAWCRMIVPQFKEMFDEIEITGLLYKRIIKPQELLDCPNCLGEGGGCSQNDNSDWIDCFDCGGSGKIRNKENNQ